MEELTYKNLFKDFIEFQKEFKGMTPDATNPFFKSSYITLDGILETVRPILSKHNLCVLQEATGDGEYIFVKTKLAHISGEILETDILRMKPQKNDPQSMGSCITYAKRYQLAALLGICESADDDGNKATYPDKTKFKKGTFSFNIVKNPHSAEITNADIISSDYKVLTETIDKKAILTDLKEGKDVQGAILKQNESLRIR